MDENKQTGVEAELTVTTPKTSILPLAFTVMIDLLGFAMFLPDLQLRGERLAIESFHLDPVRQAMLIGIVVGFGQAIYSIAQLATGTWLGRLSDVRGRRFVLLLSGVLSVVAYLIYVKADSIWILYLSRSLSGVAAANLGVAYAYVADVTSPKDRVTQMGKLGAAFGVGFLIGPVLGALLLMISNDSPVLLGLVAATLCAINCVLIYRYVPEPVRERKPRPKSSLIGDLRVAFKIPGLNVLLLAIFAMNLAFTNLETTYFRMLKLPNWIFHFPEDKAKLWGALILTVVGLTAGVTQGALIGKIVPKLGELKAFRLFYTAFIPVFASIPYGVMPFPGLIGTVLLGFTNGIAGSSATSLVSQLSPPEMQGTVQGLSQSLGSLARIISPMFAGLLFGWHPTLPYWWGTLLAMFAAYLIWVRLRPIKSEPVPGTSDLLA